MHIRVYVQRSFERSWTLSDDTEIRDVNFEDGLLTIKLGKIVPEHHTRKDWFNMALSQQTLDHLLEAEGSLRAAVRCAATNEKPIVVTQLSQLLMDIERVREFEKLQDIVDAEIEKWILTDSLFLLII